MCESNNRITEEDLEPVLNADDDELNELFSNHLNIKPPEDYVPDSEAVDKAVVAVNYVTAKQFIHYYFEDEEVEWFPDYRDRLKRALQAYKCGDIYPSIFLLISVQDGLMNWLCEQDDDVELKGEYYYAGDKRKALKNAYRYVGESSEITINTQDLVDSHENFIDHRNRIMHGAPDAYYNFQISDVALDFLVWTFEAIRLKTMSKSGS